MKKLLKLVVTVGIGLWAAINPSIGHAQECGDVDGNSNVTSSDALKVLRKAVGQPVDLDCKTGDCIALEARLAQVEAATPKVYDANGDLVGRLIASGWGYGESTWFKVTEAATGKIMEFWVHDNESTGQFLENYVSWMSGNGGALNHVFYTTTDCSGTPYITTVADYTYSQGFLRVMGGWYVVEPHFFAPVQKAPESIALKSGAPFGYTEDCYASSPKPEGTLYQAMAVTPSFGAAIELPLTMHP